MAAYLLAPFQLRLVEDIRDVLLRYGLLLAGGSALRAHGRTNRAVDGLTFVTEVRLTEAAAAVAAAFRATGLTVEAGESGPRSCRLTVTDEITGQSCDVKLLREVLLDRPALVGPCPTVGLDDAIGFKVRALYDRGLPRDFVDVASACDGYGFRSLERLGARHDDDWRTEDLVQRLETVDLLADEAFAECGLDEEQIAEVRRFAYAWAEDIKLRRADDGDAEYDLDVPEVE